MRRALCFLGTLTVLLALSPPATAQVRSIIGGKNKVRYDTFDWKVYETPHFRISFYPRVEPSLEKLASFAESSYDELARRLNYQVLEPIPMIAYATHAEFEQSNTIVGFIPEGVGAFATPVRNRMVLPLDLPDEELQALIQHELTHIFQYEILFQGRRGRAIYRRPPTWFMEGMASYFGKDESARDRAYMRDAALSDRIPSVAAPITGFFAYRFGHKVFDYIEAEWGEDGVRDFVFAFRNTVGGRISRPFEQVFNQDIEEFDAGFRSWLRRHYQDYTLRGTPLEYGRKFRIDRPGDAQEISPVASPSGDLIAAFTTYKHDVDVALFGVPDRRLYRNLTKGYTTDYEYLIAQSFTVGAEEGRDLAFSPDGNLVAVFGRKERGRDLLLLDALHGGIQRRYDIRLPIDQPMMPAFSPDGRTVAFRAVKDGQFDIFLLDLADGSIRNLTDDPASDGSPTFTPDGRKLVYASRIGAYGKLVEIAVDDPSQRRQLTFGPGNDEGPALSSDGERLFFASDREQGVFDVYQLELKSQRLTRLTYVIGMALNPVPVPTLDGERVVFQGFGHGRWDLYVADPNEGEEVGETEPPKMGIDLKPFLPAVSVSVDLEDAEKAKKHKLFIEDARGIVGVDQDSNLISQTYISLSDLYGDRRLTIYLDSIDTFSNFRAAWMNLEPRLQWGATVFDDRSYYLTGIDPLGERNERQQLYRQTGAAVLGQYPFSRYYRVEGMLGYVDRSADLPGVNSNGDLVYVSYDDQVPFAQLGLVGDTTLYRYYGPHNGSRWEVQLAYLADLDQGGTLSRQVTVDWRKYMPLSARNEVAVRVYGAASDGNRPSVFAFGGLDTMRGYNVRSLNGNRIAFTNLEWRFPLIDNLETPFLRLGDVRGRFFLDVGAAWYEFDGESYNYTGEPGFDFISGGRLVDGLSSYGFGISTSFLGLPIHLDWVQLWDFKDSIGSTNVEFWVGYRF